MIQEISNTASLLGICQFNPCQQGLISINIKRKKKIKENFSCTWWFIIGFGAIKKKNQYVIIQLQ